MNMNKTDLVKHIADEASVTQHTAKAMLDSCLHAIQRTLSKGDKVSLLGFGTFETRHRAHRTYSSLKNGESFEVAAHDVPVFRPGKALRRAVSNEGEFTDE